MNVRVIALILCGLLVAWTEAAIGSWSPLRISQFIPKATSLISPAEYECVVGSVDPEPDDRESMDEAFRAYLTDSTERIDPLTHELAVVETDVAFVLGSPGERGPISGLVESFHRIWQAREEAVAELDEQLFRSLRSIGDSAAASRLDRWRVCNSALRRSSPDVDLSFARVDPRVLLRHVWIAADERPEVPECWPCVVGRELGPVPPVPDPLVDEYLVARTRLRDASRQAMLVRARALDLDWELVTAGRAGDRKRINAIHGRKIELEQEWGVLLVAPALELERAERRLREALVATLSPEAAREYEMRHLAEAFDVLWRDPLSVSPFLADARRSPDLPEELLERLDRIERRHRAEEERRSRELIEAQGEHWATWLARRSDERSLRLGLLARRADRLLERRALHVATQEEIVAAFEEFDLDPSGLPQEPEGSEGALEHLLAEIAPFHLGGTPYAELEQAFLAEHASQQPRRPRGRPARGQGG